MNKQAFYTLIFLFAGLFLSGCDDDKRLVKLSEEAANRQAEQNKEMARQSQQTAEATKSLVAADAQARKELAMLQQNLRADQAEIGKKRDDLEIERKTMAIERKWDRFMAVALTDFGIFMVITAALAFCWYLLVGLQHEKTTEPAVEALLIEELVASPISEFSRLRGIRPLFASLANPFPLFLGTFCDAGRQFRYL